MALEAPPSIHCQPQGPAQSPASSPFPQGVVTAGSVWELPGTATALMDPCLLAEQVPERITVQTQVLLSLHEHALPLSHITTWPV